MNNKRFYFSYVPFVSHRNNSVQRVMIIKIHYKNGFVDTFNCQ